MSRQSKTVVNVGFHALIALTVLLSHAGEAFGGSAKFDKQMLPILEQYLRIPKVLAADKTDGVAVAAGKIAKLSSNLNASTVSGEHAKHFMSIPSKIKKAANQIRKAKDIKAMREALKELSKPMAMWATISKPKGISIVYCSMAPGSWLQRDTVIANPYYGASMLRCGEIVAGAGAGKKGQHHH